MKWQLNELAVDNGQRMSYSRKITPSIKQFETIKRLKAIDTFNIDGIWYYDEVNDHLYTEFHLSGNVVVADSITLEDLEYFIDVDATEVFGFDQLDDVADNLVEGNQVDLEPIINQLIVANIPFNLTNRKDGYPKGKDWEIISEEEFNKEPKPINPQMAKLLELEIDDE